MYHPTTRVLTVLELLQAHPRISGRELARRLEVTPRTIRHYITMLQDMGVPVESTPGRDGGYRLRPGFRLPPMLFTEDEALALTIGLLAAQRMGLAVAAPAVEGALAKIERVLPEATRQRVQRVQEALILDIASPYLPPSGGVIAALIQAAGEQQQVALGYRSWQGEETERAFDPYGVVHVGGRWFTAGYCHLRGDLRVFRLDRITHLAPGEARFERPERFDLLAFVANAVATAPGRWDVEVLLRTDLETAQRMVPPLLAVLSEAPGGTLLRCAVQHLDWLAHMLVGLECDVEIRAPGELRESLRRLAARAAAMAG